MIRVRYIALLAACMLILCAAITLAIADDFPWWPWRFALIEALQVMAGLVVLSAVLAIVTVTVVARA